MEVDTPSPPPRSTSRLAAPTGGGASSSSSSGSGSSASAGALSPGLCKHGRGPECQACAAIPSKGLTSVQDVAKVRQALRVRGGKEGFGGGGFPPVGFLKGPCPVHPRG